MTRSDINQIHRAYSILDSKEFDEDEDYVRVSGIATTPATDRMGDEVASMGAEFSVPMPLLWQHDDKAPVGRLTAAEKTEKGIPFTAEIPKIKEAGRLKDRVDEAIHSLKYRLVSAVSIGFRILGGEGDGYEYMDDSYSLSIKRWEWLELSLVTIPANAEAVITAVKSFDQHQLAASGRVVGSVGSNPELSGVADTTIKLIKPTYDEQRVVEAGTVKLLKGARSA